MDEILSLDDEIQLKSLTLVSTDKQMFNISIKNIQISDYLKTLYELDSDIIEKEIPINLSSNLLNIVVNFLNFYNQKPFNEIKKPVPKDFTKCQFINKEQSEETFQENFYINLVITLKEKQELINFVNQVNYLGIKPLLELVCARIANIIRDISPEDEKKFLKID